MMERQTEEWQNQYRRCEQELKTTQAAKHAIDIELAMLKAHLKDRATA